MNYLDRENISPETSTDSRRENTLLFCIQINLQRNRQKKQSHGKFLNPVKTLYQIDWNILIQNLQYFGLKNTNIKLFCKLICQSKTVCFCKWN